MQDLTSESIAPRNAHRIIALIVLGYVLVECLYIVRLPLIMDEFEGAYTVRMFASQLPYRDFAPYKTVLGYYLQLPAILLPLSSWSALLATKLEIVLVVALAIYIGATRMTRLFGAFPTIFSIALLVSMSTFLERSGELRVDALGAMAGFLALVALLEDRPATSGILVAVSFLISQKGIYFVAASEAAMAATLFASSHRRGAIRAAVRFNTAALIALLAYLAFWSAVASPGKVFDATFRSAAATALLADYSDIRLAFWKQTLIRNPVFYLLAAGCLVDLLLRRSGKRDLLLGSYGLVLTACAIWHKQPWPYFFVTILPTAALLIASGLDRASRTDLWAERKRVIIAVIMLGGIALPLSRVPVVARRSSAFQKRNVEMAEAILRKNASYFAGVDILWRRRQPPIEDLRWIDRTAALRLAGMTPSKIRSMIDVLHSSKIQLLIWNYKFAGLPQPIALYLDTQFTHFWGDIFIYGPRVAPGEFDLQFGSRYRVESPGGTATIDGHALERGAVTFLSAGRHVYAGRDVIRLTMVPSVSPPAPLKPEVFFPDVYGF